MKNSCIFENTKANDIMTTIEIGSQYNVRIMTESWFRHYGGREITQTPNIVSATLVSIQDSHQKYVVQLEKACAGFKKGHKIAVCENDFNI